MCALLGNSASVIAQIRELLDNNQEQITLDYLMSLICKVGTVDEVVMEKLSYAVQTGVNVGPQGKLECSAVKIS